MIPVVTLLCSLAFQAGDIDPDEEVILFPTAALDARPHVTVLPIHGWIFEPEEDSVRRAALLELFAESLGLDDDSAADELFHRRAAAFLVDNERDQEITVALADRRFEMPSSEKNGQFQGEVRLPAAHVERSLDGDGRLRVRAVTDSDDDRRFEGSVQVVSPTGVSVISDIDDTIKISEVHDKEALLRRTFLEEYEAAPGMAALYEAWRREGAAFHYVSSSPWQLYRPLEEFRATAGYPRGAMHLKSFRWKDETFFSLFESGQETKAPAIARIFDAFPARSFILVGDSGEMDPEIYGTLAREHPGRVRFILIRDVRGDRDAERFGRAFEGLPREMWRVFQDAAALEALHRLPGEPQDRR